MQEELARARPPRTFLTCQRVEPILHLGPVRVRQADGCGLQRGEVAQDLVGAQCQSVLGLGGQDADWYSGQAMKGVWFATVEDFAQAALKKLEAQAASQGVKATSTLRAGSGWDELLQQIKVGKHDLSLVGTRNRSTAARTFFGSTAQRFPDGGS